MYMYVKCFKCTHTIFEITVFWNWGVWHPKCWQMNFYSAVVWPSKSNQASYCSKVARTVNGCCQKFNLQVSELLIDPHVLFSVAGLQRRAGLVCCVWNAQIIHKQNGRATHKLFIFQTSTNAKLPNQNISTQHKLLRTIHSMQAPCDQLTEHRHNIVQL